MRAMILAAGRGSRMRPLTDNQPKPLLPVAGKPLLGYHLEKLANAGVNEVVINHAWHGEQIEDFVGDGSQWGLQVSFSAEPEGGLETAGGIIKALPLLGDDPFWVINGDIWTDWDYRDLPTDLEKGLLGHLIMVDNPIHHSNGDFAIENGLLVNGENENDARKTFSGVGLYRKELLAPYPEGKRALKPFFDRAINKKQLAASHQDGFWTDVGTPERLHQVNQRLEK
ncbi:UNVERIFIED_ORG: MurNAc alpha-1-phosphate uridylyltransferase [Idiomarina abyssalis]|jgi:MurNAc alpha-1-phosphate uridylyltransferase|uniref:N-acetylmuramate alpha-1-phosphate uridylyltransferase MurU n=1 Tax=Idiomarina TaxID=135575 RepID=UPI0002F4CBD6|nr:MULTISPECIES: nucleotidyltransferase family protein [Idiomarina]MAA61956.1 nucleotidyltransferase family protein [Idiomarina sp.]NWO03332.1 nucleotidyltransferase family protein [Idiomarinaceae bacterium]PHQ89292.1 MAG: nucleotidyltransferase family protein [Idiomarina sp.]PWW34130.1 MurNAc alpha-1-phosphate uridylyltransferase [Idiomarina loihiensis]TDO51845.1 MurNAc alpha-1-phosphate uridylyltransferase [Idiomarina sp. 017G]|tara:strand:- start:4609 stop:5286 length:678 start_codon:yes stop_codon:yes gene_type:complete